MSAAHPIHGERFARHGFADRPAVTVTDAVRLTTAVQWQDAAAGRLGLRSRSAATSDAAVTQALEVDRSIVRTSLMRSTLHTVLAADARWLTRLFGRSIERRFAARWAGLGFTAQLLEGANAAIPGVLAQGPATRSEIMAGLLERGVAFHSDDPAVATHVLLHATTSGLVCRGPDRRREPTFALFEDWVPTGGTDGGPQGDDALAEVARRYFAAFSPATPADFTTWSGLPSARAIELIRDELTPADVFGRRGYRLGEVAPARGLRLLSAFDNYLIGYRDREFIDPRRRAEVYVGGVIRPTVVLDGRIVGRWQLSRDRDLCTVNVMLFEDLESAVRSVLTTEVRDIGRFLNTEATLQLN